MPSAFGIERDRILYLRVEDILIELIAHLRPEIPNADLYIVDDFIKSVTVN